MNASTPPEWASQPPPPAEPPPPVGQPAGWHPDPWGQATWRWYDGRNWTGHTSQPVGHTPLRTNAAATYDQPIVTPTLGPAKKPFLPSFLSLPVVLAGIPSIALLVYSLITNPLAAALGLVPLVIVAPPLIWMDRLEPEPWSSRLHTFLWGAFVAGFVSLVVNTIFSLAAGEVAAAVLSAPFIEEITKALAIVWMVRRQEVDGVVDGLVYAGWAALGFAVVEDVSYFYLADEQDLLWETFVGRALFTPFAHPLFTAWTGLAIGLAVKKRRPLVTAWWGLLLAIGTHALWNGSLSLLEDERGAIVAGVVLVLFVALFFSTIVAVIVLVRRDRRRHAELLPHMAARYGIPVDRLAMLMNNKARRAVRKDLTGKSARQQLDDEASAIARLAAMLDHDGTGTVEHEARLVSKLHAARQSRA